MSGKEFDDLYRKCYKTIRVRLKNEFNIYSHDAEAAYNEAFLIFKNKVEQHKFQNINKEGYIYRVARNIILAKIKRDKKTAYINIDDVVNAVEKNADGIEASQGNESILKKYEAMQKALNQLSDICRKLIVAHYYEFKKLKELAIPFNLKNEGVVKNKIYRCRKKLTELTDDFLA